MASLITFAVIDNTAWRQGGEVFTGILNFPVIPSGNPIVHSRNGIRALYKTEIKT
jgi:hypothetical protein